MAKIKGLVLDKFTGEPLKALITANHYRTYATDGSFELEVPPGSYIVRCEAGGYETEVASVTVTNEATVNFLLTPKVKLL